MYHLLSDVDVEYNSAAISIDRGVVKSTLSCGMSEGFVRDQRILVSPFREDTPLADAEV